MKRLRLMGWSVALLVVATGVPGALGDHGGVHCTAEQLLTGVCGVQGGTAGGADNDAEGGTSTLEGPPQPYLQRRYVPACGANTLANGGDVMCPAATSYCDGREPAGQTAFWVYTRLFDPTRPELAQPEFERQAGYECLGVDEEGVPGIVEVVATVRRDWKRFVVVSGSTRIDPAPRSLVNVATIFSTDRDKPVALDPFVLTVDRPYTVLLTVRPERYTWHFGDGTQLTTSVPGRPRQKDVTHVYSRPGRIQARVDIEWSGTFTVNGGESLPLDGTVTTPGELSPLDVRSARSQLVRD